MIQKLRLLYFRDLDFGHEILDNKFNISHNIGEILRTKNMEKVPGFLLFFAILSKLAATILKNGGVPFHYF